MKKNLLGLLLLVASYSGFTQASSQVKTATYLNNLNNFRQVFGDQNYPRARAADVAADDNQYAATNKLVSIKDSASSFTSGSVSSLALQGFGFNIPEEATIENISVRVKRFAKGKATVGDHILSLMQRYDCSAGTPCRYGTFWTFHDDYAGKIYPATETEYNFSQSGSGNNGGVNHDQDYLWTPAMVNHTYFGVRIDNYPPVGRGTVVIYYDLVEVTVEYSLPAVARKIAATVALRPEQEPVVYPNPFTGKASIQFTAAETGKAVIELYDLTGARVQVIYREVTEGLQYRVVVGDVALAKGTYIYFINNGRYARSGRMVKLE